MKKCFYCGQEIVREATVCRFCNRAQPAASPVGRQWTRRATPKHLRPVLFAAAALVLLTMFTQRGQPQSIIEHKSKPPLEVFGKRGLRGVELYNREEEPVSACVIRLQDDWRAVVQILRPKETLLLEWSEFRSRAGNEMPFIDGERARYATVTCDSHKDTRRPAALAFR